MPACNFDAVSFPQAVHSPFPERDPAHRRPSAMIDFQTVAACMPIGSPQECTDCGCSYQLARELTSIGGAKVIEKHFKLTLAGLGPFIEQILLQQGSTFPPTVNVFF